MTLFCPACGMKALAGATFCAKCGGRLPVAVESVSSTASAMPKTGAEQLSGAELDSISPTTLKFGGFWRRFRALSLDLLLWLVIGVLVLIFIDPLIVAPVPNPNLFEKYVEHIWALGFPLLVFLYFPLSESSALQGTIGKLVLGIKVVDAEGKRISVFRAVWRMSAKLLSAIPLMIGFLRVGWTPRRQAIHDVIANTFVVDRKVSPKEFVNYVPQMARRPKWQAVVLGAVCAAPLIAWAAKYHSIIWPIVVSEYESTLPDEPLLQGRSARPIE